MPLNPEPLSRRMDRFLYQTDDPNTTLLLTALKELALGMEALEEKVDRLAAEQRSAAASLEPPSVVVPDDGRQVP